ncbi:MAG: hypothetical protein IJ456_02610 [Bacteroides sp.]|nr:hypothetical protein [Bacteroides sp.]
MKKMKWAVLFAALVSVFGFSSCLDSEEGESYDLYEYVTVDSYMGTATLVGDQSGYTYIPVTTDVLSSLQMTDGSYYKRALVAIQLAEEYVAGKTSYQISGIQVYNYIPYKSCTMNPDTLSGDFDFISLGTGSSKPWVKSGYANVTFSVNIPNSTPSLNDFNMYITGASNDTLYAKLQYSADNSSAYTPMSEMISFEIPSNVMYDPEMSGSLNVTDSLVLTVVAKGANGELKTTSSKFHRNDLY